ncbi:fumarylacetoacetate hydrolase family protein [Alloalcanivorax marinus]|uniref:fumarylacetoacetate hydrolase family protein n=1 Tax=Alloalcanivorax marinus TaxID=1177169 RepID=UPI0019330F68|nr:fumarylacetoacetate hydrolase family protein [Alloalcanivorax marinus]MBL7251092.1 fumarylacetoacetate hydrolase family protein [Alloalcanivorax marinus]
MKLVSYEKSGECRLGALIDAHRLVDITDLVGTADMNRLIDEYRNHEQVLKEVIRSSHNVIDTRTVKLLAPIPDIRRNVFCVGKNYYEHAREFANSGYDSSAASGKVPTAPIIFSKPNTSVSGPGDAIDTKLDPYGSVDYEAELAVVIGKNGRVDERDDPWSFVFGYTLINDVTARELQKKHSQWLLGKGIDGYCPMGPALVTPDELGALDRLRISCEVNGEVRQSASVSDLIFDIPTLIRTIGRGISLMAGDIIATGTPVGVGIGFKPPRYLRPGDEVRVSMPGIGDLVNPVV